MNRTIAFTFILATIAVIATSTIKPAYASSDGGFLLAGQVLWPANQPSSDNSIADERRNTVSVPVPDGIKKKTQTSAAVKYRGRGLSWGLAHLPLSLESHMDISEDLFTGKT